MSHEVVIALFEGVQSLDVTGPLEVFSGASRAPGSAYRVRTASLGGRTVTSSSGLGLAPRADLGALGRIDTLVVPGGEGTREMDPEFVTWLAGAAGRVAGVCTGTFWLAEAGLLDGKAATTHWAHCGRLAREYPRVRVRAEPIFVREGAVCTSAGVSAGIDLALALVEEDLGRQVALAVARQLVVFLTRPGDQAQFSTHLAAQAAQRPAVREVQHWIAQHPGRDLRVEVLARRAAMSPRQFARVFAAQVGVSPGRYVERVRLETARRVLVEGAAPVSAVARRCGYGTAEAMRRAFVRALGCSPAQYRERFGSRV
ncbi:GlxA family transcriptional regulator [Nocardiopsis sp. NRRL B-16309]|uniref:GlxA family transcriptional regulator n=1 Tax=Nocardiopsis sp. NRRL B-16309 TaxID=1519494 RepID=UPI0006B05B6B|nr:GlxA family transcriptional regulator [Nocardiopsis sp. NRRL B-16309]KOX15776.1 AraC family transcriptional regulator [Nocardiopsis sp. NRRL B-16309]